MLDLLGGQRPASARSCPARQRRLSHSAPLAGHADIGDLALTSPHAVHHPMLSAPDSPTVRRVADEHGAWRTFGEKTIYESSPWVRLGLVDVEAPNGERWDYWR
jgi:hypothetical protein